MQVVKRGNEGAETVLTTGHVNNKYGDVPPLYKKKKVC